MCSLCEELRKKYFLAEIKVIQDCTVRFAASHILILIEAEEAEEEENIGNWFQKYTLKN